MWGALFNDEKPQKQSVDPIEEVQKVKNESFTFKPVPRTLPGEEGKEPSKEENRKDLNRDIKSLDDFKKVIIEGTGEHIYELIEMVNRDTNKTITILRAYQNCDYLTSSFKFMKAEIQKIPFAVKRKWKYDFVKTGKLIYQPSEKIITIID